MNSNKKIFHITLLPGFTLLETLFVILLTSIVVSLVYTYFNTFQRYMLQLNRSSEYETTVLRFESLMQYDIDRSQKVIFSDDEISEIQCLGTETNYYFGNNYVVRKQNNVNDTLHAMNVSLEPLMLSNSDSLLEGFVVSLIDFNNRTRTYSFYIKYAEKTNFEEDIKNKNDDY